MKQLIHLSTKSTSESKWPHTYIILLRSLLLFLLLLVLSDLYFNHYSDYWSQSIVFYLHLSGQKLIQKYAALALQPANGRVTSKVIKINAME